MPETTLKKATLERAIEFTRIGNEAVRRAQEESRRLGVPNVYSIHGVIYFEQPDGTLSTEDPMADAVADPAARE